MAGVVSPTDRAIMANIAQSLTLAPADRVGVDHDCRIALAGGLSGRPGMVQIAGTGSSTFGVNASGESWRAGGWGQLISDEGSGYWLGVQAMQTAVRAFDGRLPPTLLLRKVETTSAIVRSGRYLASHLQ
jgi:N-acetylglucosamine kinase-like BadF-type ATPase